MAEFDFEIVYRPGIKNGKADILSKRSDYAPQEGSGPTEQSFFKPGQYRVSSARLSQIPVVKLVGPFEDKLRKAAEECEDYQRLKAAGEAKSETLSKAYTVEDGLVFYENRWLVPDNIELKLAILRENHDTRIAGHFGMKKTQERMMRNFYWPNMEEFVREYV